MVKLLVFTSCLLILFSCSSKQHSIVGSYKSEVPGYIWRFILHKEYISDTELQISTDSTFNYIGCAQSMKGKWVVKNDSLYLYCEEKKFNIDSLNHNPKYQKGTICDIPIRYKINENILTTEIKLSNKRTLNEKLKKVK